MSQDSARRRAMLDAERYAPDLLSAFLAELEGTARSVEVWDMLVRLGQKLELPYIDFISASSFSNWKRTRFIRTSYDSTWLNAINEDPDLHRWSYFRSHAMHHLTPVAVGLEFIDEYHYIPAKRAEVLKLAAAKGMRAGFSIPLRIHAPPQAGLITFSGDHSKRQMKAIIKAHGWTLNVAALMAHQRYITHFSAEFSQRNEISNKQRALLELVGSGLQDKQIAEQLQISVSAVRQRMHLLMEKTGMTNRAELAALAMSLGVLPDPLNRPENGDVETLIQMDKTGVRRRK